MRREGCPQHLLLTEEHATAGVDLKMNLKIGTKSIHSDIESESEIQMLDLPSHHLWIFTLQTLNITGKN